MFICSTLSFPMVSKFHGLMEFRIFVFAEVKDVVHPVLYLLSDKSDMISGITMPVDGGALAN